MPKDNNTFPIEFKMCYVIIFEYSVGIIFETRTC